MRTDQKLFCLKTCLTIFLWILWVIGAGVFGVVLWLRLDFWTSEYLELDSNLDRYLILIYVSLAAGALITVFSIFGLLGGCLKVKWLLAVYLATVVLAALVTVSAVVYGAIFRNELQDTLVKDSLLDNIINGSYHDDHTHRISRVVNIVQSELECCGANDPLDYAQSKWGSGVSNGPDSSPDIARLVPVPASCCREYPQSQNRSQTCYVYQSEEDNMRSTDIWQTGCKESIQQFLDKYIVILISVVAVFFVLQIICIIVSSIYIHLLNSLYVPQPDDIVYDMAHNQEKSPYPSRGDYRDYQH